MEYKLIAVLAIIATIAGSSYSVNAQSPVDRNSSQGYTLSGDSLTGINQRTFQGDFRSFFGQLNYINTGGNQLSPINQNPDRQFNNSVQIKVNQPVPPSTRNLPNLRNQDGFDSNNTVQIQLNNNE